MSTKTSAKKSKTDPNDSVFVSYPNGYCGQDLNEDYIFISNDGGQAMLAKHVDPHHYLQNFAEEVTRGVSLRAQQYLKAYRVGQRFLWTFAGEDVAFLSLVVLLPIGPRTVMCISTKDSFCDEEGDLKHHTETVIRWGIESQVGTSTHCK